MPLNFPFQGLKEIQKEKPVYRGNAGAQGWWSDVIKRTAIGAGAQPQGILLRQAKHARLTAACSCGRCNARNRPKAYETVQLEGGL